jgi:hypothetical protein
MYMQDNSGAAMAVATDRSQGGASIVDGSMELMVQRRTLVDDSRGVGEPMNETAAGITACPPYGNATRMGDGVVVKGKHFIRIGEDGGARLARSMMDQAFVGPLVYVGSAPVDDKPEFVSYNISGIDKSLPSNLMLITRSVLYNESKPTVLVRIGHQYGLGEDEVSSEPVSFNITTLVPGYEIVDIAETTLSANQDIDSWKKDRKDWVRFMDLGRSQPPPLIKENITIEAMDIRTFLVQVK